MELFIPQNVLAFLREPESRARLVISHKGIALEHKYTMTGGKSQEFTFRAEANQGSLNGLARHFEREFSLARLRADKSAIQPGGAA